MGILEWTKIDTPDSVPRLIKEIFNPQGRGASIIKIAMCNDSVTMWAVVRRGDRNGLNYGGAQTCLLRSNTLGMSWDELAYNNLCRFQTAVAYCSLVWDIAVAPDDPNIICVVCSDINKDPLVQEIWISMDKGNTWKNMGFQGIQRNAFISSIDISLSYGKRKIVVGLRDGSGKSTSNILIATITDMPSWTIQNNRGNSESLYSIIGDILCAKFSPNFSVDHTIVTLYTDGSSTHGGTWLTTGEHDIQNDSTIWQRKEAHIEVKSKSGQDGDSPTIAEIIGGNLELPFNFSGHDRSRCRFYVSTDAAGRTIDRSPHCGIFTILNGSVDILMDNTNELKEPEYGLTCRRISSIALAPNKLLAGGVLGNADLAVVPTWNLYLGEDTGLSRLFRPLKLATGAGSLCNINGDSKLGFGNAQVIWSPDYSMCFTGTGSAALGAWALPKIDQNNAIIPNTNWPAGYFNVASDDESSLSISRDSGETWNQLSLINTSISKLNDVAVASKLTTIYLASIKSSEGYLSASVWRSTIDPNVSAPYPAVPPIGANWERVFLWRKEIKAPSLDEITFLLRMVPTLEDGEGRIVAVAEKGSNKFYWSPDFGYYWVPIEAKVEIEDFIFESTTNLYVIDKYGILQRLPYTGTSWSNNLNVTDIGLGSAYCIISSNGYVIVGASESGPLCTIAYCKSGSGIWTILQDQMQYKGNLSAAIDPDVDNNGFIYIANDAENGSIYRQSIPFHQKWSVSDIISNTVNTLADKVENKWQPVSYRGLVIARTPKSHPALYSIVKDKSDRKQDLHNIVYRCTNPHDGIPFPGIVSEYLDIVSGEDTSDADFSLKPTPFKVGGCNTIDTNTTIYALDNNPYASNHNVQKGYRNMNRVGQSGMLWTFTDCLAKRGPILRAPVNLKIGSDEVTGRNPNVYFAWDQLCLATSYQIQISADIDFSLVIYDSGIFEPVSFIWPSLIFFAGGCSTYPATNAAPPLERGQTYYWRCRARGSPKLTNITSPWSEITKFNIDSKTYQGADIKKMAVDSGSLQSTLDGGVTAVSVKRKHYDIFIAHASEDKDFAAPLALALQRRNLEVWYDDFILTVGDSLGQKIDEGLVSSDYGIVILSHNFFNKHWPRKELDGLLSKERLGKKVILPIWHNIDKEGVEKYSPSLAGIIATSSKKPIGKVVEDILLAIQSRK